MNGRHCGKCSNPWIDNLDCSCVCHQPERTALAESFATPAKAAYLPYTRRPHRKAEREEPA